MTDSTPDSKPEATTAPRALKRGLDLLVLLRDHAHGLAFSTITRTLELSDASAARLLQSLLELGHIEKDLSTGWYRACGPLAASGPTAWTDRLKRLAKPFLEGLRDRCQNTTLLIARTDSHMLTLDRAEHEDSIPLQFVGRTAINYRNPPWGWFFVDRQQLAASPEDYQTASWQDIDTGLAQLANQGWCVRSQADRCRLAAPIRSADGTLLGALAVGGSHSSLPASRIPECGAELLAHAKSCSHCWQPSPQLQ